MTNTEAILEYILSLVPSDQLCSYCDGEGSWISTTNDTGGAKHTLVICPKCGDRPPKDVEAELRSKLTSFEEEIRESEQSRIVNGLQKQLDQRSDEVGDLVEMWCNGILCSIDYIKSLSTKED